MLALFRPGPFTVSPFTKYRSLVPHFVPAKTTSQFQFDDSRLGRVKELISDLRTRLDVADKLTTAESNFCDEIPLDKAAPENIVDQVTEYFGQAKPEVQSVAVH